MKINLNNLSVFLLILLMSAIPVSVWSADDEVRVIDGVSYHVLRSADDWSRFRQLVHDAAGKSDVNAIMEADFTVTEWVGLNVDEPFRGIFNGNGHTLDVQLNDPNNFFYISPFSYVTNATIRNLHVTGSVLGGKHSSGLVGTVGEIPTDRQVTIERVWVSVTVTGRDNSKDTGEFVGGFVGHARKNTVKLTDCLFDGKLLTENSSKDDRYGGAFIGWGETGATYDLCRLYDNGRWVNKNITEYNICFVQYKPWAGEKQPCIYSAHDWEDIPADRSNFTDQVALMNKMNENQAGTWKYEDGKAMPVFSLDATFECYDIVPGSEAGEEGMLKIPFSCDQAVNWIDAWYTDENGNRKDLPRLTLPENSYSGFLTVPATEAHRDLKMTVSLTPIYIFYTYDPKSDAVIHNPRNLTCDVLAHSKTSMTNAGAVVLHWDTKDAEYNDLMDGDMFMVYRSLTGKAEDMTSIGSVMLDGSESKYEFKDSTLISALKAENIDGGKVPVAYWVVRTAAQQLWGMSADKNPTLVTIQPQMDKLALLEPTDVKAEWSDKEEYKVKVTWNYKANDDTHRYVWDSRIGMKMKVNTFKKDGSKGDSTVVAVAADQIRTGEMEVQVTRPCLDYELTLIVDGSKSPLGNGEVSFAAAVPEDKFYHESLGHIDKESLTARELQSSVLLTWANVDDEPVDFYEVWRRDVTAEKFDSLAQVTEMQYEDKTTSPVHQYEYFVRGVNDCEGYTYEQTKNVAGQCAQTGAMEGYVRFVDGTGIPGVEVNITSDGNPNTWKATTDESGAFRIADLPYLNGTETTYTVAPNVKNFSGQLPVTFKTTPGGNMVKGVVFEVENSIKFTGYVQYSGTSIPVQGVSFYVDGHEMHNAAGKVVSDHEGKFSFRMLDGDHAVRAFKEGHVFKNNGYYYASDDAAPADSVISYTESVANRLFWDDTRVTLIGRVAGGKDQGDIPLGNSLSRNNLGDNLQIVLALEGDNASRLVSDIKDRDKKERDEEFEHVAHDSKYKYKTKVHTTLNRMIVTPDVHTGEYMVKLPPVKWKIQQITAQGYATLFQSGQVGDVIDLTDSLTLHTDTVLGSWTNAEGVEIDSVTVTYNAKYSRIYHSPVVLDFKQIGYDKFDYFGDQYYNYKDVSGNKQKLTLAYGKKKPNWPQGKRDSLETKYTFGYPVFSIDRKYPVKISATERYYYNNNQKSDTIDVVKLSGGLVTIHNGMVSSTHRESLELDSLGEATYSLEAAQVPYLLTGANALRTVTMTLALDGTHYEADPLRAYILNVQQLQGAKDVLNYSIPLLIDILRDPPGGSSKATLSKGSTLQYSYQMDLSWSGGLTLNFSAGNGLSTFTGFVAAPMGAGGVGGFNNAVSDKVATSISMVFSGSGNRAFNYTMTVTEDISTSDDKTMVGANADLYIGVEQNIVIRPATAIRAIPDSIYWQLQGQKRSGRLLEIAMGVDENGSILHLVRDEVMTYGPVIKSNFIHSQEYITKQLMPSLTDQCLSLMFTGTKDEAVARANATGEIVYWSKVLSSDKNFGVDYEIIVPTGFTGEAIDEVARYHENLLKWTEMIGRNEQEKMTARSLVSNYDIDGGTRINYGETFSSNYSETSSYVSPISASTVDYFDNTAGDIALNAVQFVGPAVAKLIGSVANRKFGGTDQVKGLDGSTVEVSAIGWTFRFNLVPAMTFNVTPRHTETKAFNRTESFSIGMDKRSHLNFDVYRVETTKDDVKCDDPLDVFVGNNFYESKDYNRDFLNREMDLDNYREPRSFVYRTRGGATCRPYEDERRTNVYNPKTIIDERTKKIENPVIKMDKQSISGVPFGEPARFKLYLANESEQPEATYLYFTLYQKETSNPSGAKLMMDGMPVTGDGRTVEIHPGQVTVKTLEVYAGEKFDYENLTIGLISQGDVNMYQEVSFDVHYLQTAGEVTITTPGDKWIMNCDAPQDGDKGWFMPVIIAGFDKNQHNFDHIEFQYKESTRGDDYWTNLCGYYADSLLYKAASGTKEMIPENGNISTRFFGEGTVMEKAYDLRAVLFCRNGNAFLTHESKVLSGVKDTRRPQLFGNPEPTDGVLEVGENIIFNFSENIEYNYLQGPTNFEVIGETNETNIQEAPALQFTGHGFAQSEVRRNFANKDVTIELMVKPDDVQQDMPVFSHGRDGKQLQLWIVNDNATNDKHMRAIVDGKVLEGQTVLSKKSFQRVAMALDSDQKRLTLFTEGDQVSMDDVTYCGYGPLIFGSTNETDTLQRSFYTGRMMQGKIWNRTMDINNLNMYSGHQLTGYEQGLIDYYPMNEGRGKFANDLAQGAAHLTLERADWALPRGMALKLDKDEVKDVKGMQLQGKFFDRTAEEDYTLMFWFKTDEQGRGTLLCNGSGRKTDVEAVNKFFIGFEEEALKYRANGREFVLGDKYSDGRWHHYAMTVNRARQLANIYVDQELKAQFSTDSLGAITGDLYLGNMVWSDEGPENDKVLQDNALTGHVDCITLFKQALPKALIKRFADKALGGEEKDLLTYIDFERQELQSSGDFVLQPFAWNKKVKVGKDEQISEEYDSVFVEPVNYVMERIDRNTGAPVQAFEELKSLNFSFVGRDNSVLVNIDEPEERINKRTVYATVRDIPDMNGNFMASPATISMFVDLNPLRWSKRNFTTTVSSGAFMENTFSINILNNSGVTHTYTLDNLPKWLTVDVPTEVLGAKSEKMLTFSINKDINVGSYDEIIYLTDENGLSEPLTLNITVEGKAPGWSVSNDLKRYSMSIVGCVDIEGDIVTDSRDQVAAFDSKGRCMGVGNIKYNPNTSESMVYMSVYDSVSVAIPLYFRLWHYETGKVMLLTPSEEVLFIPEGFKGTAKKPLLLHASDIFVQQITLLPGWNWISLNVMNDSYSDVKKLLDNFTWRNGDMLTDENHHIAMLYEEGEWLSNYGTTPYDQMAVKVSEGYRIKVGRYETLEMVGSILKTEAERTITVRQGWNSIGYTPIVNLPVTTALADYFDEAEDGDVVKSKTAFAMFSKSANGTGEWKGDLEYMKPGEGYMLYRNHAGEAQFVYPFYDANESFFDETNNVTNAHSNNMTLTAVAEGIELMPGDKVTAYADAELVGESVIKDDRLYMTIAGDRSAAVSFVVERDGEIIAVSENAMDYAVNAISGSYNEPTKIHFATADREGLAQDGWFSLQGIKLEKQPAQRGVYILNGRKHVVR